MTTSATQDDATKTPVTSPPAETPPVVTKHTVTTGGKTLSYCATAGFLPIRNDKGELEARLSFAAYTAGDDPRGDRARPLMILFNGGPGSSSVWLHLGGLGPRRVRMLDDGGMPPSPFEVIENEHTWLEFADLVFIDPVDTGYSRAESDELTKKFLGVAGDLELIGEFIRLYLTRYGRWGSPLFLGGESYGTFRSAGLAGRLIDKGIAFNGIVLISSVLELGTLLFDASDDIPYPLYLPTYAATAWYHGKLAPDLQARALKDLLAEVEAWSVETYLVALVKGAALPTHERARLVASLARYTGLDPSFIEQSNLRLRGDRFVKELLRDRGRIVGRLDSRHTGYDGDSSAAANAFDPSMSAIRAPFTAALNDYIRRDLGFEQDAEYHILRGLEWNWGDAHQGAPATKPALSDAFARNPYLHLFVASGYFDLATAYFATSYTLGRLGLDPTVMDQVTTKSYPGGHMIYVALDLMAEMKRDVAAFVEKARAAAARPLPAPPPGAQERS